MFYEIGEAPDHGTVSSARWPILPVVPSGAQHEISHGDQRAVVVEVGGGLRLYDGSVGPLLDGYDIGQVCSGAADSR